MSNGIQVSGFTCFEEGRWREAILYYLFGIWAGRADVAYRPKLMFGGLTLRLNRSAGEYYAYGTADEAPPSAPCRPEEHVVLKTWDATDVEVALIQFVKNNGIRRLTLPMRHGELMFWKKQQRGQYGLAAISIPRSWGTDGPVW